MRFLVLQLNLIEAPEKGLYPRWHVVRRDFLWTSTCRCQFPVLMCDKQLQWVTSLRSDYNQLSSLGFSFCSQTVQHVGCLLYCVLWSEHCWEWHFQTEHSHLYVFWGRGGVQIDAAIDQCHHPPISHSASAEWERLEQSLGHTADRADESVVELSKHDVFRCERQTGTKTKQTQSAFMKDSITSINPSQNYQHFSCSLFERA